MKLDQLRDQLIGHICLSEPRDAVYMCPKASDLRPNCESELCQINHSLGECFRYEFDHSTIPAVALTVCETIKLKIEHAGRAARNRIHHAPLIDHNEIWFSRVQRIIAYLLPLAFELVSLHRQLMQWALVTGVEIVVFSLLLHASYAF